MTVKTLLAAGALSLLSTSAFAANILITNQATLSPFGHNSAYSVQQGQGLNANIGNQTGGTNYSYNEQWTNGAAGGINIHAPNQFGVFGNTADNWQFD